MVVGYYSWFLVMGYGFWVAFALLLEKISIRKALSTKNLQPTTNNHCTIMLFSEIEENNKNIFWCLSYGSCFASSVSECACVLVSLRYTPTSSPQAPTATKTSKEKNNKNPWSRFFRVFSFVSYKAAGWWKGLGSHWETDRQGRLTNFVVLLFGCLVDTIRLHCREKQLNNKITKQPNDTKAVFFVFFKTDNRSAFRHN